MRNARQNLKFLDDLAKAATGALGSFSEIRTHIRALVKERVDQVLDQMDMVSRDEFDRVAAMAEKARLRQEALEDRLAALEGKKSPARKKTAASKAQAKMKKTAVKGKKPARKKKS
jgi:BMFP domain-containing protein YqiC